MNNSFVIRGNICQTMNPKELDLHILPLITKLL